MTTADVIDRPVMMPASVEDQLQGFRDTAADRRASLLQIAADRQAAATLRDNAETRLRELRRHGFRDDDDHPNIEPLLETIKRNDATIARLNARADQASPAWEEINRLVVALERYVGANAAHLALHDGGAPVLQDGENAVAAKERSADRVRALKADRLEVLAAPFPTAIAKKIAWDALKSRAEAAAPDVGGLIDALEPINWPVQRVGVKEGLDVIGVLAWLLPIEMKKAIDREIDDAGDDKAALTIERRAAKLAVIDADLLSAEREEFHFATLAGSIPRADADPRAVLQLSAAMPAPQQD